MEIQLKGIKGGIALVSNEDYPLIFNYSWYQDKDGYAHSLFNKKNTSNASFNYESFER